jgi:predicted acetyltransferase
MRDPAVRAGKGYTVKMLGLFLKRLRVGILGRMLITCDDDNLPAYRTIERCGGKVVG